MVKQDTRFTMRANHVRVESPNDTSFSDRSQRLEVEFLGVSWLGLRDEDR